jgi:hypothetical protein
MSIDKNIQTLKSVKEQVKDPNLKKEIDKKIKALSNNKPVQK